MTKNYQGEFPLEHSLVVYYVPKHKIKEKGKKVMGGRAIFANDKIIKDSKLDTDKKINDFNDNAIKSLYIQIIHRYLGDTLGTDKLTSKIVEDRFKIK